ncbi:MAG: alpha/beta fold hydrolase [Rhizobiaceae bacterium]|nr:alpha/beta fold hydrolase [Rhizobiaceae bacterium]
MGASKKSQEELALEAWSLAMSQMLEAGQKALRSGGMLSELVDDDVQIAEAEYEVVFEIDKVRLFKYAPTGKPNKAIAPVVICYGLFGRQSMIDLQEDRSLVRNMLAAGITVYVVDWGNPTRADQFLNFDDYVDLYLGSCMEFAVSENNNNPVNMFGICEGGTFAVMLAATRPELFAGLALAITPVDFHGDQENFWLGEGFLNTWIGNLDQHDIDLLIETYGMLPGAMTGAIFSSLTPINSMTKYNIGIANLDGNKDAILNFLRMEKWIADRPDHPGELARQWLNGLYRENQLVKGEFELLGEKVDLAKITCPVLNIYAHQDHIIPVSCSKALGKFIPKERYQEIGFPGGHVGVFVSRKAQGVVSGGLIEWLEASDKKPEKKAKPKAKSE